MQAEDELAGMHMCEGASLAGYKVPRAVEFRDNLPITATGKVLRRLLRDESH